MASSGEPMKNSPAGISLSVIPIELLIGAWAAFFGRFTISIIPFEVFTVRTTTQATTKPSSNTPAAAHQARGPDRLSFSYAVDRGRRFRRLARGAATGGGVSETGSNRGSVSRRSMRPSKIDPGRVGSDGFLAAGAGAGAISVPGRVGAETALVLPCFASGCPTGDISGFDPTDATVPFLKNGVSACATSLGSWNRRSGSLAIILPTSAASSTGTSGRARFSGRASRE